MLPFKIIVACIKDLSFLTHTRYWIHKNTRIYVLLLSLLVCTSFAGAQPPESNHGQTTEIEYGYPDQSIFVATTNAKGQPDSPMTRLAEVLMEKAGLNWHPMPYPAKRLFDNLKNGKTNFSILVRASSLQHCCIFSREPVYTTKLNVYFIGDKKPVKSETDLAGKKIITIRGYSYAGLLKFISDPANKIINEVAGTHRAAFEMLKGNRADYVVDYESAASYILNEMPIENIRFNPISNLDIFLVLSKSYPDAEKVMIKLEDIAKTLDINAILKNQQIQK